MKKIVLIASVLLLVIIVVARLYFSNISGGSRYIEKSLESIPNDASIIFEFTNDKGFYEIFSGYTIFDDIIGDVKKNELIFIKNQLSNNQKLAHITDGQNLFLSLYYDHTDSVSFLWIMPLKEDLTADDYSRIFKDTDSSSYRVKNDGKSVFIELVSKKFNKTFYLDISDGIAKGSYSKSLLLSCLDSKRPKISKEFITKIAAANLKNENSPANAFINLQTAGTFLKSFYKSKNTQGLVNRYDLHGFASLNMNFKSDALVFNGLVYPDTNTLIYQNIFLHQKPITNTINRIVPENTSNFVAYGFSDYKLFSKDLREFLIKKHNWAELHALLTKIKNETGINLDQETAELWDKEFISFQLSTQEQLGCIKLTNGEKLNFVFEPLSSFYSDKIRKLNYPSILYAYFGDPFKHYSKPYYTIIDNYFIFSNSAGSIQRFLSSYNNDKVLFKTTGYVQFSKSVADMSNIFFFVHNYNSRSYFKSNLKSPFSERFDNSKVGLNKFYGLSCQFTSNSTYFFTNVFSEYNQNFLLKEANKQATDTINSVVDLD
ncbi:MAG: hypothetical protein JWN56_96 [Sphingobacteriales bacterium]|nr:hypothetical protein [Sphingobacteriales bacterium]